MRAPNKFMIAGTAASLAGGAFAYWDYAYHGALWLAPILGVLFVLVAATAIAAITSLKASSVPSAGRVRVVQRTPRPDEIVTARPKQGKQGDARAPGEPAISYEQGVTLVAPLAHNPILDPSTTSDASPTNILCGTCGAFFDIDLQSARPVPVDCPACSIALLVEGQIRHGAAVELFCRSCHHKSAVPKAENVASYLCASCGHVNQLRAVGEARTTVAPRTPTMH